MPLTFDHVNLRTSTFMCQWARAEKAKIIHLQKCHLFVLISFKLFFLCALKVNLQVNLQI